MTNMGKEKEGNFKHIGQIIQQMIREYNLTGKFDEANVIAAWDKLAGKAVAKRTKRLFLRNHVLFVELSSAAMKNDLNLHKSEILNLFKKELGSDIIREIIIM